VLLTFLFPGAGHLYLGLNQKAMPYFVANAIALTFSLIFYFLLPIGCLVWLVTVCMTIGSITQETNQVNDALRRGHRING
jgi:TM2 domain-containing membrane protein YozV